MGAHIESRTAWVRLSLIFSYEDARSEWNNGGRVTYGSDSHPAEGASVGTRRAKPQSCAISSVGSQPDPPLVMRRGLYALKQKAF